MQSPVTGLARLGTSSGNARTCWGELPSTT
jgi:hypothetical protein